MIEVSKIDIEFYNIFLLKVAFFQVTWKPSALYMYYPTQIDCTRFTNAWAVRN